MANRNNANANDIVVYLVATLTATNPNRNLAGCATHPDGRPGVAVMQVAMADWLTSHEVGHVLGLNHVCTMPNCAPGQSDSLMFPNTGWTNLPPDIATSEENTMRNSSLTTSSL